MKPNAEEGLEGGRYRAEYPIHHSNVMHYSIAHGVRSRAGKMILENGRKVRYLKKTGELI